jgi:hypothetical protein
MRFAHKMKGFKMQNDRKQICKIISQMLDTPDGNGIYPTTVAYNDLERYVESVRNIAIGWTHARNCSDLDNGLDPRKTIVPELLDDANKQLSQIDYDA